ncbi:MAG: HesA/MoeB/ThiF family protein [Planctomycetaceae bacterium]|jgi:adenylyltransferase/sulfurtransferase|nr:HesA/MoeB/ThiF family protein [Planctomycetaceae bacterium]
MPKSSSTLNRYRRQIIFEPLGTKGQRQLGKAIVFMCGCGALGCNIAQTLVRAGIKCLKMVDFDRVSLVNLHRQFLFTEKDVQMNRYKVTAAAKALRAGNSEVEVVPFRDRLTQENAVSYIKGVNLVIDATDNFPTRFLLNQTALQLKIPFISGGVTGAGGQVMTIIPGQTPCLSCLIDFAQNIDTSPKEFPILAPIVQVVSAFQSMEAIKILTGNADQINPNLITFDMWGNKIRTIPLDHLPPCRCFPARK